MNNKTESDLQIETEANWELPLVRGMGRRVNKIGGAD